MRSPANGADPPPPPAVLSGLTSRRRAAGALLGSLYLPDFNETTRQLAAGKPARYGLPGLKWSGTLDAAQLSWETTGMGLGGFAVHAAAFELISDALEVLEQKVTVTVAATTPSHTSIGVIGLDEPAVAAACAHYLIGCLAGAIGLDAKLSKIGMIDSQQASAELSSQCIMLLGASNSFTTSAQKKFRDERRNAWIAEGVAHALLVARRRAINDLVPGSVLAIWQLHAIPSEPGLDAVALYADVDKLVVAIGESKASQTRGAAELANAAATFAAVDAAEYGVQLRAALTALRPVIPAQYTTQVSDSLWRDRRCYLPFILHERAFALNRRRQTLERLEPDVAHKRLVAMRITGFHDFFDRVADEMRRTARTVEF